MKAATLALADEQAEAQACEADRLDAERAERAARAQAHMDSAIASLGRAAAAHDRFVARQAALRSRASA